MASISVVGLGKLGAPLAAVLSSKGHWVIGVDSNAETVRRIQEGVAPVPEPGLQDLIGNHPFVATYSYKEAIRNSEITFVIVPTPSAPSGEFINDYVCQAMRGIGDALATKDYKRHVVVVCSTTMPGSTNGDIRAALESTAGESVGMRLGLCYSPEFIALGSVIENMLNPDMVLIGESSEWAGDALEAVLSTVSDAPVKRMSILNAEIAKIAVNTFITMKISYANQLAEICEKIEDADAQTVVDAIGLDSRIGRKYLSPGTAFGGPCFPRDTKAFSRFGSRVGIECALAEATDEINKRQTDRLVALVPDGANVGVLGLAYKPDTPVIDESPGLQLARKLASLGFSVSTFDPKVDVQEPNIKSLASVNAVAASSDMVFIMLPSEEYTAPFPGLFEHYRTLHVIDCWGTLDVGPWEETNVTRLGKGCLHSHR